jgi:hypothetical protein
MPGALFIDAVCWVCDGKSRRYVLCIHGLYSFQTSAAYNLTSTAAVSGITSMAHSKNNNPFHRFKFEIPFIPPPHPRAKTIFTSFQRYSVTVPTTLNNGRQRSSRGTHG